MTEKRPVEGIKRQVRSMDERLNVRRISFVLAVVAVGVVGTLLLTRSHAATPTASFQAEAGTLTTNAVASADATASGGQAVRFTAPASGGACPVAGSNKPGAADPFGGCYPGPGNTGYKSAPGYDSAVALKTNCPTGINVQPNTTYSFCDYPNGLTIGDSSHHPANVTFIGCRFSSNAVQDANVRTYGDNTTFQYSSFIPSRKSVPPVAFGEGYQYGVNIFDGVKLTVDHSEFWGFGNAIAFDNSSQAQPVTITNNWIHDASGNTDDPVAQYHTDGILVNNGGPNVTYVSIRHNTIVSEGITNGIALQYETNAYDHITVTNNYLGGFGITVNIGGAGADRNTNVTFTGNVWASDIEPYYYPIYNEAAWVPNMHNNNYWKNNKIVAQPGSSWMGAGNNGLFWWPADIKPTSTTQIVGHSSDYPG